MQFVNSGTFYSFSDDTAIDTKMDAAAGIGVHRASLWHGGNNKYGTAYSHPSSPDAGVYRGLGTQVAIFRDEKAQGTAGGSSSATTNHTRVLNTTHANTIAGCSLASNQITLPAGTYRIRASAPAFIADKHKLRWYNVTDTTYDIEGSTAYADTATDATQTNALLVGRFTIATAKTYELRHYIQTARATNGLGVTIGVGTEVYAEIEILKES